MTAIAVGWIEDGTVVQLEAQKRQDARARQALFHDPMWKKGISRAEHPPADGLALADAGPDSRRWTYGNFALMAGYNTVITDAVGATVYSGAVNSQQAYIDINAWGAAGVYYLSIYDVNGAVVAVRQIVIQ